MQNTSNPTEAGMRRVWWKDTELAFRYGVHRVTIWSWVRQKKFPPPHQLGANTSRWHNDEIAAHDASILEGEE